VFVIVAGRLFSGGRILPGHSDAVAAALRAQAAVQGVVLHEHSPVLEVQEGRLQTADGGWHAFDEALWCTQAAAAAWLRDTGLPVGERGCTWGVLCMFANTEPTTS